jgi:hypothetical protein
MNPAANRIQSISFDATKWTLANVREFVKHANLRPMTPVRKVGGQITINLAAPTPNMGSRTFHLAHNISITMETPKTGGALDDSSIGSFIDSPLVKILTTVLPFLL